MTNKERAAEVKVDIFKLLHEADKLLFLAGELATETAGISPMVSIEIRLAAKTMRDAVARLAPAKKVEA